MQFDNFKSFTICTIYMDPTTCLENKENNLNFHLDIVKKGGKQNYYFAFI